MNRDRDLRRMCAVQNSDDSGIGIVVPDVAYPVSPPKVRPGVDPNHIDSAEDKMRKLQAIYDDDRVKLSDRIKAMELHHELQLGLERKANPDANAD